MRSEFVRPWLNRLEVHLEGRIITGVLILTPLVVTFIVLRAVFHFANGIIGPAFTNYIDDSIPASVVPVVGFAALFAVLYALGMLARSVLGTRIVNVAHNLLGQKIPVIKTVYGITQQALDVLSQTAKQQYKRVVLVDFPREGTQSIGLVTGQYVDDAGRTKLGLYIPTVPNPTSGFFITVPEDDIIETDFTVDEAMRIVLSAGILAPSLLQKRQDKSVAASKVP